MKAHIYPHSTANPLHAPKHTLHTGRTYTVWNSSSGGSSVCDDTLELHVWVTVSPGYYSSNCSHSTACMCAAVCTHSKECEFHLSDKQACIGIHALFLSLCDTKPPRLLNLTAFLHIHTTEGEAPCSRWQNQRTLQPFCSVLMTGFMGVIMVELSSRLTTPQMHLDSWTETVPNSISLYY